MASREKGKSTKAPSASPGASKARVDPELDKQLSAAQASTTPVQAVFRLRSEKRGAAAPSPERTEALAHELLSRVKGQAAGALADYNVFRNLGYFVVSAEPRFIRKLIEQPEVASAQANRRGSGSD
jgi:hypothetical protein